MELLFLFEQWAGHWLLFGLICVLLALFPFPFLPVLFRKESKFGEGVSFLARALGKMRGSGFCLVRLVGFFQVTPPRMGATLPRSYLTPPGVMSSSMSSSGLWVIGVSGWCSC